MVVIEHKWLFFTISGLLVLTSILGLIKYGLNLGVEFKGGSIIEIEYQTTRPEHEVIQTALNALNLGQSFIQPSGERGLIIRTRDLSEIEHQALLKALTVNDQFKPTETRFSSIGPTVGQELARKGLVAIAVVVILIILFIAIAFYSVSYQISSWKYGLIAIIALIHDVTIPTGVFAYLGHFRGTEVGALFLTALLAIMGLSVNDTIVIFDRIRENLKRHTGKDFAETVGLSLNETFIRSLNTSLTVILALLALYFFGDASTKDFALVLTIGMIVGTYSSIFIASPLLVVWERWGRK